MRPDAIVSISGKGTETGRLAKICSHWALLLLIPLLVVGQPGWCQPGSQEVTIPTYSTTHLLHSRQMHGAAVLGDYLYVLGGAVSPEGYSKSVDFAQIHPDGSIGDWNPTTPLPSYRAYICNSTLALNDMIYVVGGMDNGQPSVATNLTQLARTAYWSRPGPDGQLGPWQESPPWPGEGMSCLTVVATPGYLHVLGGSNGNANPTATVHSGVIGPDGSLIRWEDGPPLPVGLWFHNAVAVGGRVWVYGGLTASSNTSASANVYSSRIQGDGRLGPWRQEQSTLPMPFYSAVSASAGDYLMAIAPRYSGGTATNEIWYTQYKSGQLAPWQRVATQMNISLYLAAAPDYRRGVIYVPGGRIGPHKDFDSTTYYYRLRGAAMTAVEGTSAPSATGAATVAPAPTQRYTFQAATTLSSDAVPGFLPYEQARAQAAGPPPKPLLLYFNAAVARRCQEQNKLLQAPGFAALANQAAFAWITIDDYPQLVHQLGIYRVPTWVLYDSHGNPAGQVSNVLTLDQLRQGIASAR